MPPVNTQKQQQELFDEFVVVKKTRGRFFGVLNRFNKPIFPQHRLNLSLSYESLIIILIGAVLVASIIFSLGVERGRGLGNAEIPAPEAAQPVAMAPVVEPVQKAEPEKKTATSNIQANAKEQPAGVNPFTIQVASYKTRDLAEKEMTRLKAAGYSSEILKKGDYFILCVGSFATKDAAKKTFAAMEKRYKNCLLRKR